MIFVDPDGRDWYRNQSGNVSWQKRNEKSYVDNEGLLWNNIGIEYLYTDEEKSILFKQSENEDREMYLDVHNSKEEILRHMGDINDVSLIKELVWNEDMPSDFMALETAFVIPKNDNRYIDVFHKLLRDEYIANLKKKGLQYRYSPVGMQFSGETVMYLDFLFQLANPIPSLPRLNKDLV